MAKAKLPREALMALTEYDGEALKLAYRNTVQSLAETYLASVSAGEDCEQEAVDRFMKGREKARTKLAYLQMALTKRGETCSTSQ